MPPLPKRIEITFNEDGSSSVEAHGFSGQGCKAATADYERAIGTSGTRKMKPEANVSAVQAQKVRA